MKVIGLDLSLASTGLASSLGWVERYRPRLAGMERLRAIRDWCREMTRGADLVVVEGLSFGSVTGQHLTRAGMWHLVMEAIDRDTPWAQVAPGPLKRYAT